MILTMYTIITQYKIYFISLVFFQYLTINRIKPSYSKKGIDTLLTFPPQYEWVFSMDTIIVIGSCISHPRMCFSNSFKSKVPSGKFFNPVT